MHRNGTGRATAALSLLLAANVARADPEISWIRTLDDASGANGVVSGLVLTASGDVVSAGHVGARFAVVKQRGTDGETLWGTELPDSEPSSAGIASAVAIGKSGDAFAAGYTQAAGNVNFTVVRLSDVDGSVLWTRAVDGPAAQEDVAFALALDKSDDVLAAGSMMGATTARDFAVVKLDGKTGSVLWQRTIAGSSNLAGQDSAQAIAVDADGNAIATGYLAKSETGVNLDFTTVKLDGATGSVVWTRRYAATPAYDFGHAVAVAPGGDAIVAGTLGGHFTVMRLRASDGSKLWQYQSNAGSISPPSIASKVVVTSGGIVVGGYEGTTGAAHPFVVKLNGTTGAPIWEKAVGTAASSWSPARPEVLASGEVLAAGGLEDKGIVVRLKGSDGSQIWRLDQKGRRPSAVALQNDAFFVGGSADAGANATDYLTMKLSVLPSCVVGNKIHIECACDCGIHQVCLRGKCKTIEPAQPTGHLHTDKKKKKPKKSQPHAAPAAH